MAAYPRESAIVPSQALLERGEHIFSPFHPVLTEEIEVLLDLSDDETERRVTGKERRIPYGLSAYGIYYGTLGAVHNLAGARIDHTDTFLIDPLNADNPGLSPHYQEFNTYLINPQAAVWCVAGESVTLPSNWSGTICLHPDYVSVGLSASTFVLPPGFCGRPALVVYNHNPILAARVHRGHGIFCYSFVAHGLTTITEPQPPEPFLRSEPLEAGS